MHLVGPAACVKSTSAESQPFPRVQQLCPLKAGSRDCQLISASLCLSVCTNQVKTDEYPCVPPCVFALHRLVHADQLVPQPTSRYVSPDILVTYDFATLRSEFLRFSSVGYVYTSVKLSDKLLGELSRAIGNSRESEFIVKVYTRRLTRGRALTTKCFY